VKEKIKEIGRALLAKVIKPKPIDRGETPDVVKPTVGSLFSGE
jgi:hypothetical protein